MPRDALGWGFSSLEDQQSYQRFRRRQTHKDWELEGLVKMGRTPQYEQRVKRRRKEFQRKEEEIDGQWLEALASPDDKEG